MKFRFSIAVAPAAILSALVFASVAGADLGVTAHLDTAHTTMTAVAVNHTGAGDADPGDIYTVESGGFTEAVLRQYSADGVLKRELAANANAGVFLSSDADIAINQASGDVYLNSGGGINVFSGDLVRERRIGYDAAISGPDDSSNHEQQKLTVIASGGTFTLKCCTINSNVSISLITVPLPYNATAQQVEDALNQLSFIADNGHITVTGGPGDAIGAHPYTITFDGNFSGDDMRPLAADASGLTGSTKTVRIDTLANGGGFEKCASQVDDCGTWAGKGGGLVQEYSSPPEVNGALGASNSIAVVPPSAPNAGNLLVADDIFSRISEYTAGGDFVRSFGWDAVGHGPDDGVVNEQQRVTLGPTTTGGRFSLLFEGNTTGGTGNGDLANASTTVNNVNTATGAFAVGQVLTSSASGAIPTGTTISAVDATAGTLTLSQPAGQNVVGVTLTANDIAYDASAVQVQSALNALPSIGGAGGSVNVSGADGGPYTITFGGNLGGDNVTAMTSSAAGLTVSSGSKSVAISTLAEGGSFEVCLAAADSCKRGVAGAQDAAPLGKFYGDLKGIAEDSGGAIYVVEAPSSNLTSSFRVQKFTPPALYSPASVTPTLFGKTETQSIAVDATAGKFRLAYGAKAGGTQGTGTVSAGSNIVTNVATITGEFKVGHIFTGCCTQLFPTNKTVLITAVTTDSLTLDTTALDSKANSAISSDLDYETPDLEFNAPATGPGSVQEALNGLPSIADIGGSVSVTGGSGTPYLVTFNGGPLEKTDPDPIKPIEGSVPLSGGSGPDANKVVITTPSPGGPNGLAAKDSPLDVAIDDSDRIFISKNVPVGLSTCEDGSQSPPEIVIQVYSVGGAHIESSTPCIGLVPTLSGSGATYPSNLSVDRISGEPYLAHTAGFSGSLFGAGGRAYVFGDLGSAPELALASLSDVSSSGVTVSGTINPNGPVSAAGHPNPVNTTYRVQYQVVGASGWTDYVPSTPIGTGISPTPFNVGVSGLSPNTPYNFRVLVAKLGYPTLIGNTQTETTAPASPSIDAMSSSGVTSGSADLNAIINPLGTATSYHFEYGQTLAYGQSTPEVDIGAALAQVPVSRHITGLDAVVYHFRVVASNSVGTTTGEDQTFSFYPEPCPNETARQQTGSGSLPDCRAYELVSPGDAGAASLSSGAPNSPYASAPSRLSFNGSYGAIPGPWNPPNVFGDRYLSTRTDSGWQTRYVAIPADVTMTSGGAPDGLYAPGSAFDRATPIETDLSMSRSLVWDRGKPPLTGGPASAGSSAPYLYGADGNFLGRLPTNLAEIPNGDADIANGGFFGDTKPSADLSHYFFSSANVKFAPGGLTDGGGSVYDNDLAAKTVVIASKLPGGNIDIPQESGSKTADYINTPDASVDGTHLLMAAFAGSADCGAYCDMPAHLYMRVNAALTYDVSQGHLVGYAGMTRDGSTVYFSSREQLTSDDTDDSVDLFMWSETTDSLTRLSATSGAAGDMDACNADWTSRCNVEVVSTGGPYIDNGEWRGGGTVWSLPTDNFIAADSGDIYFYSPEQFVASKGIPGRRNLYVYHGGDITYVTTLAADRAASRIQVSDDGQHMAFITSSQITAYDNLGYDEMYKFDLASTSLRCVSCKLSGAPPTADVKGSQNGIFVSEDGRTFFDTTDAIVPTDSNGLTDVYEYTGGRPRLISSGVADRDSSSTGRAGLVGVSKDGVDVYFATFDKLVAQDDNAKLLRFYDARTNGGFPLGSQAAPCGAADECHGSTAPAPARSTGASAAHLGSRGNVRQVRKKKTHGKKHTHRNRHGHHHHRRGKKKNKPGGGQHKRRHIDRRRGVRG